jgi:putative glutamine amidotransferase
MTSRMMPNDPKPVVGVSACLRHFEERDKHMVDDKYVRAVAVSSGALPLIFPAMGDIVDADTLLDKVDGIMLTGSPSNVHPEHYGAEPCPKSEPHDRARDTTTLPLIEAILGKGVPLLAICRGFQELNVALGGTLHVRVHEVAGRMDHRRPQHPDPDVQYGPSHPISLAPNGQLSKIFGCAEMDVNSLLRIDMQCVDRAEGCIPLPSFRSLFGAKERPDPPRPGVPLLCIRHPIGCDTRHRSLSPTPSNLSLAAPSRWGRSTVC